MEAPADTTWKGFSPRRTRPALDRGEKERRIGRV